MKKNFFKKLLILSVLAVLFFSLMPGQSQAQGLVPCGPGFDPPDDVCQFCHFFVLFDNIVKFVLQKLVPLIAVLMIVIGGVMFFTAAGDPAKIGKAKGLFTAVAIGLVIIYSAYLLVSLFFTLIGVAEWTGLFPDPETGKGWFEYPCP